MGPLPNLFWCDPSFTPTFKVFHYQWVPFCPVMGPFTPAHWAETDYGLSAGQHAVVPEGKCIYPLVSLWSEDSGWFAPALVKQM